MRRLTFAFAGLLLFLGGIWYGSEEKEWISRAWSFFEEKLSLSHSSQAEDSLILRGTGTLEVKEIRIASKTSGYIRELLFREGNRVKAGQLLARIDRPDLEARKAREKASLEAAQFRLADMRTGARPEEIAEIRARLEGAKARHEQARKDAHRFSQLREEKIEEFQTALEVAASEFRALEKKLEILYLGAREERIREQEATVKALEAAVTITQSLLEETFIRAPRNGRILVKNVEKGEYLSPGNILGVIGDMEDCWVRLYIPSVQLGKIRLHQDAKIWVDSFPNRTFTGHVSEIAGEAAFTPRESLSQVERSNLSFRVKIQVPNPEEFLKPGMPADVEILP